MFKKKRVLQVENTDVAIRNIDGEDYISLTDMLKSKDGDFFVSDWLRNRNTVEFLDIWERMNNPDFNYGESAIIKSRAGLNGYKLSVKDWVEKTNAIGIKAIAGRYGGTFAHKDIAFEFGMWYLCGAYRCRKRPEKIGEYDLFGAWRITFTLD